METAAAHELLDGIAARDFARIEACFHPDARLRALTPHRLRELVGARAIADQYRFWLERLSGFSVVAAVVEPVADRVRVQYRFFGVDPEHGRQENEHTAYASVEGTLIDVLNLTCAGFRPAELRD
jgi:SnoaL-like domain